jgi:ketosteroid isomerase-like protein
VTSDEVIVLGDYAVQRGEFILKSTPRTGGAITEARRRYVEVLKKDAQGDWAVYWGIDGPLAGAPSPEKSE